MPSLERRLGAAARAYERDRYPEALAAIKPVVDAAPSSAAVRELYGLILYRLGRWRNAAKELREFHALSGSFDQHPVIADCERAMRHLERVEELWTEIRRAGVDRDVLVEGRLVMAGALADAGRLTEAIELLKAESRSRKHPDLAHLREWYALADLYERAGDLPRARRALPQGGAGGARAVRRPATAGGASLSRPYPVPSRPTGSYGRPTWIASASSGCRTRASRPSSTP